MHEALADIFRKKYLCKTSTVKEPFLVIDISLQTTYYIYIYTGTPKAWYL